MSCVKALTTGLSLIELLVTLSVAVVLLTVGVPSFIDMIAANTAVSYANDLLADLNYARNEAITRGLPVTVCHSRNATSCTGAWSDGWIVFVNSVVSANATSVSNSKDILRVHGAINTIPGASSTTPGWVLNSNYANYVQFSSSGLSNMVGTFVFCKDNQLNSGNQPRSSAVTVNRVGRARVLQDTDGDGRPNKNLPNVTPAVNLTTCIP